MRRKSILIFIVMCCLFMFSVSASADIFTEGDSSLDLHCACEINDETIFDRLSNGERVDLEQWAGIIPEQPTVYLTFDDGPSPWTEKILDLLQQEEILATFFVLGQQAEKYPETMKRIHEEGHQIGNHTYDHQYEALYSNFTLYYDQIKQTESVILSLTGESTTLVRSPGGTHTNFDAFYFYFIQKAGYQLFDWNVDSGDSKRIGVPSSEIIANVKNSPLKHEMNVLFHDSGGHEETVKALPDIIAYFRALGYDFQPLTPSVKPIQFSIGKQKWHRTMTKEQFATISEKIEQDRIKDKESTIDHSIEAVSRTMDTFQPIRLVSEERGGYVTWDASTGTATTYIDQAKIEWNIETKLVQIETEQGTLFREVMPDLTIENGRMKLPSQQIQLVWQQLKRI
ncbi:polysaccharide deacetylase family protein [Longirhabdus pacifica]|uniref:polysaccharide deacetylase family protein n=1 Tax=Longirhabdus pacifica TaxID=2305227 RepID=UPI0013E8EF64|nr:polysaccharide deacetylase family protein [Longirhabdus pacifica]